MNTQNEQDNIELVGGVINRKSPMNNMFPVPHNVFEDEKFKKYTASIRVVYFYMAKLSNRFSDDDGWFWKLCRAMKDEVGLNIKTIREAIKKLIKDGFLEFKKGRYDSEKQRRYPGSYRVRGYQAVSNQEPSISNAVHQESQDENYDDFDEP